MQPNQQSTTGKATKATASPTRRGWHQMNRKQRRELTRRIQAEDISLEVVHPDAAGIDIGSEAHLSPSRPHGTAKRYGDSDA